MRVRRHHRLIAVLGAAIMLIGGSVVPARAATDPELKLISAADEVDVQRWSRRSPVYLDLGVFLSADRAPFRIDVQRSAYDLRPTMTQVFSDGSTRAVDVGFVTRFTWGLRRFLRITATDASGAVVIDRPRGFCPNGWEQIRVTPDAPDITPFPQDCGWSPLVLGSVWGIEEGYATRVGLGAARIPDGTYTFTISIADHYADFFGIAERSVTVKANVTTSQDGGFGRPKPLAPETQQARPAPKEPEGSTEVPGPEARPDLVASPAWSISTRAGKVRDFLEFAATVWNAGPANLVVDGYRQRGEDVMDAYQSFYDGSTKVGTVQTGTMVYDPRPGHEHWHFQDFAQYRLLDADLNLVRTSGKEAFCVVPTDAIDLTLPGAVWQPERLGFGTWCGNPQSLSLREVLPAGWGDTYYQSIPGQSINITNLPNGTYYLEVVANPDGRLHEVTMDNNSTLREIVLGGSPLARTVEVKPAMGLSI